MAKKETITISGDKYSCFNVSFPAGVGGFNEKGDVLLLQAMFNFIALGFGDARILGIKSKNGLPALTGALSRETIDVIRNYEYRWAKLLWTMTGLIYPADYKNQDLELDADTRRPTITLLHQHAADAAVRLNETDYTTTMLSEFPELKPFIKQN